jgi:hypothetical protein
LSGEGEAAGAGVVAGGAGRVGGGAWRGRCGGGISGAAASPGFSGRGPDATEWNGIVQPPCQHIALAARRKARPARERDGGIGAFWILVLPPSVSLVCYRKQVFFKNGTVTVF